MTRYDHKMTIKQGDGRNIRVLQFLDAYEKQECLWNPALESYKNKAARNEAYMNLIQDLNLPSLSITDVKLKVKSIRTTYTKELRLHTKHKEKGKSYTPKLFWFNRANSFLKNVSLSRDKRLRLTERSELEPNEYKPCVIDYLSEIPQHQTNNESEEDLDHVGQVGVTSPNSAYEYKSLPNADLDTHLPGHEDIVTEGDAPKQLDNSQDDFATTIHTTRYTDALGANTTAGGTNILLTTTTNAPTPLSNNSHNNDECELFCRAVAAQLRSVSDSYSRSVAKLKIQQILFEAETGHYRNHPCVTIPVSQLNNM